MKEVFSILGNYQADMDCEWKLYWFNFSSYSLDRTERDTIWCSTSTIDTSH